MNGLRATLLKLAVFIAVCATAGVLVLRTIDGPSVGHTDTYRAVFTDVTGLRAGDTVRAAGVVVGSVSSIDLRDAGHAVVTFEANRDQVLTTSTYAVVRYANLLGQRFLALTQDAAPGRPLPHGATIPQSRTRGALSLTVLFNGFQPLFRALDAQQINTFSMEVIQILQGEGGTISDLFRQTAQLTGNLAQRDTVFVDIVDNLGTLLHSVAAHDVQLAQTVSSLDALTRNLARQSPAISRSIDAVDALGKAVTTLVTGLNRGEFGTVLADVQQVAAVLARNTTTLDRTLVAFPQAFQTFSRVTQYGNWVNAYPCTIDVQVPDKPSITGAGIIAAIRGFIGSNADAGTKAALNLLQATLGTLLGGLSVPLPLDVPSGEVTPTPSAHSAVCR